MVIAFVLGIAFTLVVFIGLFECGEVQFPSDDEHPSTSADSRRNGIVIACIFNMPDILHFD